jgi:4-hydroxy-tetrahydrodipicolinate synthase
VADAIAMQDRLVPLHDSMFCESNPVPVKYGASLLGRTSAYCRLPLAPISDEAARRVREAMTGLGLLDRDSSSRG